MAIDDNGMLSIRDAGDRLGFSAEHMRRLIEAGELAASQPSDEVHAKVPMRAILGFERRRSGAERRADEFSRSLDEAGAPAE